MLVGRRNVSPSVASNNALEGSEAGLDDCLNLGGVRSVCGRFEPDDLEKLGHGL